MVTENSALSPKCKALTVELQPEGGDFYLRGWGEGGNCLLEAVEAAPTPGASPEPPQLTSAPPSPGQCHGLCEVTTTQEFQANEGPLLPTQQGDAGRWPSREGSVFRPSTTAWKCPHPSGDRTPFRALGLPVKAPRHMTSCLHLSWGDSVVLRNTVGLGDSRSEMEP